MTVSLSLLIPDDKNDFIKFLITDVEWRALLTMSIVRLVRRRFSVSDESGQGVVELGQGLDVDGKAGVPVLSDGVQR